MTSMPSAAIPRGERDDERAALAGSGAVRENQRRGGAALRRVDERRDGARLQRNMKLT